MKNLTQVIEQKKNRVIELINALEDPALINLLIRCLMKYPTPLNLNCHWKVVDVSGEKPLVRVYRGHAAPILLLLLKESALIPWKYLDTSDPLYFIDFDEEEYTSLTPIREGESFEYTCRPVFSNGFLSIPEFPEIPYDSILDCFADKDSFKRQAGFANIYVPDLLLDILYPEHPEGLVQEKIEEETPTEEPDTATGQLTGEQIAARLELQKWDYNDLRIEDVSFLHPEKLLSSHEMTEVPSTLELAIDFYRSGDVWKSPEGHFYLYLGVLGESGIHAVYILGSEKTGIEPGASTFNQDELNAHLKIHYYTPIKYQ